MTKLHHQRSTGSNTQKSWTNLIECSCENHRSSSSGITTIIAHLQEQLESINASGSSWMKFTRCKRFKTNLASCGEAHDLIMEFPTFSVAQRNPLVGMNCGDETMMVRWIHRQNFMAVRGWRLRLKREVRRVGVREGIEVLSDGSYCQWGRKRMVKIWEGRSGWWGCSLRMRRKEF